MSHKNNSDLLPFVFAFTAYFAVVVEKRFLRKTSHSVVAVQR